MTQWVANASDLPPGSHALSFHASLDEAVRTMADFLLGAHYYNQPARVYTDNDERWRRYRDAVSVESPWLADAVQRIPGPHTCPTPDGRRPVEAAMAFANDHPNGATLAGDTIPDAFDRGSAPEYLRYEAWFDGLRPFRHRAMCPYDLVRMPVVGSGELIRGLLANHSHVVLSSDARPAVRLVQLLALPSLDEAPREWARWIDRARDRGLIDRSRTPDAPVALTMRGSLAVRALRALPP